MEQKNREILIWAQYIWAQYSTIVDSSFTKEHFERKFRRCRNEKDEKDFQLGLVLALNLNFRLNPKPQTLTTSFRPVVFRCVRGSVESRHFVWNEFGLDGLGIMEPITKLLATSSQAQGVCLGTMKDRFSGLPDVVVYCIFSFLNFRELLQVSTVSKRCREWYMSRPSLEFRSYDAVNKNQQSSLLNYLDRFLVHRGEKKIERFHIKWNFYAGSSDEIFRLITWIYIAARCNVEVLEFELSSWHIPETLGLPSCIFLCQSLRSLLLDVRTMIKAPSLACSSDLQYLTLNNITIDEGFGKWISSCCKCIKRLKLYQVKAETISIQSSSLESFTFKVPFLGDLCQLSISGNKILRIHIEWLHDKPINRSLKIFAPNLKYLKWIGHLLNHQDLGNLMRLEKAKMFLKRKANDNDFDNGFDILCSISRVKYLILTEDTTKALCREDSMPTPFNGVSYLILHIGSLNDDLVPQIVSLLRGMPDLNVLTINTYPSLLLDKPKSCKFNREYWKSQSLGFVLQLKVVRIELSHGYNGWEFARYILEHAENLEKMVIFYLRKQSYVTRKVNKCKIISNATVIFQVKEDEEKIRLDDCRHLYPFTRHP